MARVVLNYFLPASVDGIPSCHWAPLRRASLPLCLAPRGIYTSGQDLSGPSLLQAFSVSPCKRDVPVLQCLCGPLLQYVHVSYWGVQTWTQHSDASSSVWSRGGTASLANAPFNAIQSAAGLYRKGMLLALGQLGSQDHHKLLSSCLDTRMSAAWGYSFPNAELCIYLC